MLSVFFCDTGNRVSKQQKTARVGRFTALFHYISAAVLFQGSVSKNLTCTRFSAHSIQK